MTIGDKIRAMSDEELAELFVRREFESIDELIHYIYNSLREEETVKESVIDFLKQEAE